jgi:hypothetical protein
MPQNIVEVVWIATAVITNQASQRITSFLVNLLSIELGSQIDLLRGR